MALTQDQNGPLPASAAWRKWARRLVLALLALFVIIPVGVRIRCFLMTQRIRAVLGGMEQIRIDETTEAQLLKTVPELVAFDYGYGRPEFAAEQHYKVDISNEEDWQFATESRVGKFIYPPVGPSEKSERATSVTMNWLGYRFVGFDAYIVILNGKVSNLAFNLAWELWPHGTGNVLSVRSYHGFWEEGHYPGRATDLSDQAPQYRAMGSEKFLGVRYTYDAPINLVSHAFQLDLSCFWSLHGCLSARQIAPLLWMDKENVESAAALRLNSEDPCPDRLLADRARYMLDMNTELLELVGSRKEESTSKPRVIDYRPKEVLLGEAHGHWLGVPYPQLAVPVPHGTDLIVKDFPRSVKPGDLVLAFTGVYGRNCTIVPATASAIAAIRHTIRAPRRREDSTFDYYHYLP